MKKFSKVALVALMLVCSIFAIVACGVDEIALDSGSAPRAVYVQGQDLDLSVGSLTVKSGDKSEQVALNAKGVSVTGYNKDQLGNQELTVEYKGKTTTYLVNVVPRVAAENIVTDYFVGESLNTSTGRLRITKDDGTNFTVLLSDSSLSYPSATFTSAGTTNVEAHYSGTEGDYTGSFSVNVYTADQVDFVAPEKLAYKDYETELNLEGGKFTLTGNSGKLKKEVALTADMTSGYNPSAVNASNKSATQTIDVSYLGKSYNFEVTITYSNLSLIRGNIAPLKALDWSQDAAPAIDEEVGELALASMSAYNALDYDEYVLVSSEDVDAIVRAATVYGKTLWTALQKEFEHTFALSTTGTVLIVADNYDAVKENLPDLLDDQSDLYSVVQLLYTLSQNYSTTALYGSETVASYLGTVCDPAVLPALGARLQYMVELYDTLQEIPADWKPTSLVTKKDVIIAAVKKLAASPYASSSDRAMYALVSSWRQNDDFFYILWYYFHEYDQEEAAAAFTIMQNFQFPVLLETLYQDILGAMAETSYLAAGRRTDTSIFQYYYADALGCVDQINALEDTDQKSFYASVYNYVTFSNLLADSSGQPLKVGFSDLLYFLKVTNGGYLVCNIDLYGDEEYEALWSQYLAILSKVLVNDTEYYNGEQYGTDVQEMFDAFIGLSPAKQLDFLYSLCPLYGQAPAEALAILGGQYTPWFTAILEDYFAREFDDNESAMTAAYFMLRAVESYARRFAYEDPNQGTVDFLAKIGQSDQAYGDLDDTVKDAYDAVFNKCCTKYTELQKRTAAGFTAPTLSEADQAKLDALADDIRNINLSLKLILGDETQGIDGIPVYTLLISAYEDAEKLVNEIMTGTSEDLKKAYLYDAYEDLFTDLSVSLDYALYGTFRYYYVSLMNSIQVSAGNTAYLLWDAYYAEELSEFMVTAGKVMWSCWDYDMAQAEDDADTDGDADAENPKTEKFFNADEVKKAMSDLLKLDLGQQTLFMFLERSSGNWFLRGISSYVIECLGKELGETVSSIASAMLSYVYYLSDNDGAYQNEDGSAGTTFLQDFLDNMKTVIEAYENPENTEKVKECLGDVYDTLKTIYDELTPSAGTGSQEG